jgi:hypothetical protein
LKKLRSLFAACWQPVGEPACTQACGHSVHCYKSGDVLWSPAGSDAVGSLTADTKLQKLSIKVFDCEI